MNERYYTEYHNGRWVIFDRQADGVEVATLGRLGDDQTAHFVCEQLNKAEEEKNEGP